MTCIKPHLNAWNRYQDLTLTCFIRSQPFQVGGSFKKTDAGSRIEAFGNRDRRKKSWSTFTSSPMSVKGVGAFVVEATKRFSSSIHSMR